MVSTREWHAPGGTSLRPSVDSTRCPGAYIMSKDCTSCLEPKDSQSEMVDVGMLAIVLTNGGLHQVVSTP